MTTGELIKAARKDAGLTQAQLSEKSGVAAISIHQYEAGKRQPRLEQLLLIAKALKTTVGELAGPGYWSSLSQEEREEMWKSVPPPKIPTSPQERINAGDARERVVTTMEQLSPEGQVKVADYAEDILPRYSKGGEEE